MNKVREHETALNMLQEQVDHLQDLVYIFKDKEK
jgi:hypothetical protein